MKTLPYNTYILKVQDITEAFNSFTQMKFGFVNLLETNLETKKLLIEVSCTRLHSVVQQSESKSISIFLN